jgi:carbonic anhydrase/acetyltransferase-like protein (isoleucine patch superfamily)
MLVEHRGKRPTVHESAWIAPAAVSVGDVRVGGVVHVNSTVADGEVVPIGWVAVGDRVLPPDRHDDIWAIQEGLDFPGTVYGEPRGDDLMARVMPRQTAWLAAHRDDRVL